MDYDNKEKNEENQIEDIVKIKNKNESVINEILENIRELNGE